MTRRRRFCAIAAVAAVALGGCTTLSRVGDASPFHHRHRESLAAKGNRISLVDLNDQLKVAPALKGQDFFLPGPVPQAQWPVPGGTPEQTVEHVDAAPAFEVAWKRGFGSGSSRRRHVTAPPIAADGRIYVMDGGSSVSAHDGRGGETIWRRNIMPKSKRDHEAWGGGLAFADGKLYASSGFREVVQLDAATGAIGWRARTEAPTHGAPTVFGGRVFVVDVNDELLAFDAATGASDWTYQALTEPARMLVASSPAVANDTVVASFASGELVALRAENGNELWNESLSRTTRTNALSEIRDIAGRPVIYKDDVYAVSHADVFAATDLRTGTARWTLPVSAITTPWPVGDVVFVVDQTGQVICASRESGQLYWIRDLNEGLKKKQRAYWSSPILADNRLIVASSTGVAVAINPKTGVVESRLKLGTDALIGPIAAGGMVYIASDGGQLIAIR